MLTSFDDLPTFDLIKQASSPNASTVSDFSEDGPTLFKLNSTNYLDSCEEKNTSWGEIESKIMDWFASKDIREGHPQQLKINYIQEQRKSIALKVQKNQLDACNMAAKRLKRNLTINL